MPLLFDAVVEIEISEIVEYIVVFGFADRPRFEFGNVLKDLPVSLGLFLPSDVIVSWPGILYPLQYLLVLLRYSLQFPPSSLLTQRVGVLDTVVRAVDPTLELHPKTVSERASEPGGSAPPKASNVTYPHYVRHFLKQQPVLVLDLSKPVLHESVLLGLCLEMACCPRTLVVNATLHIAQLETLQVRIV